MSYWKGFAQAFKEADERKREDELLKDAREFASGEKEADRKYARDDWDYKFGREQEAQRSSLLAQLYAKGAGAGGRSGSGGDKATANDQAHVKALTARLKGVEGAEELIGMALESPGMATELMKTISDLESAQAEKGVKGYRLEGEDILSTFRVYGVEGFEEGAITLDDIDGADLGNDQEFFDLVKRGSRAGKGSQFAIDVNPDASFIPSVERERFTEEAYQLQIIRQANEDIARLIEEGEEGEAANLKAKVDAYDTEGGLAERVELQETYGEAAMRALGGFSSTRGAETNPLIPQPAEAPQEFATKEEVQAAINAGTLKEGDTVNLNGRTIPIKFE